MVFDITTTGGFVTIVGILVAFGGVVAAILLKGHALKTSGAVIAVGLVVSLLGLFVIGGANTASTIAAAPPNSGVNALLNTGVGLPAGETWNSQTSTMTVDLLYNNTGNNFCISATATTVHGCYVVGTHPQFFNIPLKLIRTDAINQTFSFPMQVTGIPTANSLGANPATYSLVGYKPPTATATGQWQIQWSAGTTAGLFSTVNAPSVSTNILPNGVPVQSFNSKIVTLQTTLAGANSTSAPQAFAQAIQNFTSYSLTISIGQGTPAIVNVQLILLAWTT